MDCVARAITAQVLINPRYCFPQHFLKCIVFRCCFGFFERRRISPSPFNPLLKLSPLLIPFTAALSSIENTLKSQRISFFNQQFSIFVPKSGDKFKEYRKYNSLTIWYPLIYDMNYNFKSSIHRYIKFNFASSPEIFQGGGIFNEYHKNTSSNYLASVVLLNKL